MAIETAADRHAMLDALGELFLFEGREFRAVFESPYEQVLGMDGARPTLTTDTDLVPDIAQGDTVTRIDGAVDYTVRAIEPDAFGMLRIILEEV